jgi:hypothetical protein
MKFPYGIADFYKVITGGYFYVDRTACLPQLESAGEQLLFLRPRRFGKSLWLSTLENYYDLRKTAEFDRLFGKLTIGQNPTPLHNQYFVLKWDFSVVNPHGDADAVERSLHSYLNSRIEDFAVYYETQLPRPIKIDPTNALASFQSLLTAVRATPHLLYLLIDEYDNFANEILMSAFGVGQQRYASLVRGEGALKTVFKAIKAAAGGGLDRVFITGVTPLVLSDVTSGYNIAKSIYFAPPFAELCGFTEAEVSAAVQQVVAHCGLPESEAETVLADLRLYYNGYRFSTAARELVYNPTLALYYLDHYRSYCEPPKQRLDDNLTMDRNKLGFIATLPGGSKIVAEALTEDPTLGFAQLANRFGVADINAAQTDETFVASLFYYLGILTLTGGETIDKLLLRIPNLVIRKLYVEQLQTMLLPTPPERRERQQVAETFYQTGDLQPVCDFIEQRYFKVFSNRDYLHANELTVKTAFLTLLFNDALYIMDSETQAGRRYADLTLIVRPDARQYEVFDLLLECKFIKLGDLHLSGEAVRALSRAELAALPLVQEKLAEARTQAPAYRREIEQRYQSMFHLPLRLRTYAVVALGFERLVWEEISA